MNGDEICCCGHVWDEHSPGDCGCEVDGCDCFYFEEDEHEAL